MNALLHTEYTVNALLHALYIHGDYTSIPFLYIILYIIHCDSIHVPIDVHVRSMYYTHTKNICIFPGQT